MGRGLLFQRQHIQRPAFPRKVSTPRDVCGISHPFGWLSPSERQITHVLLTRPPLYSGTEAPFLARLACVKPAANVRSEPGSNSPLDSLLELVTSSFSRVRTALAARPLVLSLCCLFRPWVYPLLQGSRSLKLTGLFRYSVFRDRLATAHTNGRQNLHD